MFSGQAAIDHLAVESCKDDPTASSHWLKYHSEFKFNGQGFDGLQGFGGLAKRQTGMRAWLMLLLQWRFRRYGRQYDKFAMLDLLASRVTASQNRAYDLDVLRQTITLAFLHAKAPGKLAENTTCCVIGDGFASMTALLLASRSAGCVVLVNLSKTLLVDLWYLKLWMGAAGFDASVDLVVNEKGLEKALAKKSDSGQRSQRIIAIQAIDHELIQSCPIDFVVNIASMQEMNPNTINAYFEDLRVIAESRELLFYCCNRMEKKLPDGTITRFAEYPWRINDQIIDNGFCPWHQHYYSIKPPFYHAYDGPILHRLSSFSSNITSNQ